MVDVHWCFLQCLVRYQPGLNLIDHDRWFNLFPADIFIHRWIIKRRLIFKGENENAPSELQFLQSIVHFERDQQSERNESYRNSSWSILNTNAFLYKVLFLPSSFIIIQHHSFMYNRWNQPSMFPCFTLILHSIWPNGFRSPQLYYQLAWTCLQIQYDWYVSSITNIMTEHWWFLEIRNFHGSCCIIHRAYSSVFVGDYAGFLTRWNITQDKKTFL